MGSSLAGLKRKRAEKRSHRVMKFGLKGSNVVMDR